MANGHITTWVIKLFRELTGAFESDEVLGVVRQEGGHVEGRVLRGAEFVLLHDLHQPDDVVELRVVQHGCLVQHHQVGHAVGIAEGVRVVKVPENITMHRTSNSDIIIRNDNDGI